MSSNSFERLAALVFADEAMAAELAALDNPAVLAVRASSAPGMGAILMLPATTRSDCRGGRRRPSRAAPCRRDIGCPSR